MTVASSSVGVGCSCCRSGLRVRYFRVISGFYCEGPLLHTILYSKSRHLLPTRTPATSPSRPVAGHHLASPTTNKNHPEHHDSNICDRKTQGGGGGGDQQLQRDLPARTPAHPFFSFHDPPT
ncbi:hypothetical protein L1987_49942 [Smallanthus sonchifolius]|uniref:Uncharacterized protein n=1 Tax=Smallanthus sonchifolius TaxID=185202 RepID=A0ACB9FW34_9ASTR|nr:hypothetical protein L1987_49942 [Smallanthus sonchifolius]